METHILHQFPIDFYGAELKICLAGYLRDEKNFESIDDLKVAIQNDIDNAKTELGKPEFECLSQDSFFSNVEPNPKETTVPANDVITTNNV